ncbi:hypothetical protein Tco_1204221 [Tanacetum coccineum]
MTRVPPGGSWRDSGEDDDEKVKNETCLVAHASSEMCLGVDLEPNEWIKDNGCSKNMTGNRKLFSTYKAYNGDNVEHVDNLGFNLLSIGQIGDNKCRVTFSEHDSEITKDGKVVDGSLDELVYMVPLRKAHVKPTSLIQMISSRIFEKIEKSQVTRIQSSRKNLRNIQENGFLFGGDRDNVPGMSLLDCFIGAGKLENSILLFIGKTIEQKPRRDRGTRRGRQSTSSSTFDQPSSSHLNDDDGNDEGTSCASTPSPIRYVNSLTNQVPQVFQNPPNIDPHLEPFYTRQTKIINRQVQLRDEQRGGVRSIRKSLRRLWRNMKK